MSPVLAKIIVQSPATHRLFSAPPGHRLHIERDEGPNIYLQVNGPVAAIEKHIREMELKGRNPNFIAEYYDEFDQALNRAERENIARDRYREAERRTGTLHVAGNHVIDICIENMPPGKNAMALRISKHEVTIPADADYWATIPPTRKGARGTRTFDDGDVPAIAQALRKLDIALPENFEADLRRGIAKATPRPGKFRDGLVDDVAGETFSVDYLAPVKKPADVIRYRRPLSGQYRA